MFRQLTAPLAHLRPGTFARTTQAIDELTTDSRELKRIAAMLTERQRVLEAATTEAADEVRELKEQLARVSLRESQLRAILQADVAQQRRYDRLDLILKEKRIAKYVGASVERAELQTDPFPHVVVEDLFPPSFYKVLVNGIPPVELFEDSAVNHQQLPVPFTLAPAYSRRIWKFMVDIADTVMLPVIVEKFRAPLGAWIAENWPQLANDPLGPPVQLHSSGGRIMLRRRGYNIPPHRDPKWGFITCLMYLARPGDLETWGTSLYAVEEDKEARGALPHWISAKNCRAVREVPFKRNSALLFLNSSGAHGASIPEDAEPAELERYAYQFRMGPTRESIKALMDLLPEDRRAVWAGKIED
jgi:hypothetical protein